jgi:GNAT superfamily N-acetyltransferase
MDLSTVTLTQFLAFQGETAAASAELPRDLLVPPGAGNTFRLLKMHDGYSIVALNNAGDVAAIDPNGDEAGFYSSDSLVVHEEHRGRGLATALALWAYAARPTIPPTRSLSDGGKAALTTAWEVANGKRSSPWWP